MKHHPHAAPCGITLACLLALAGLSTSPAAHACDDCGDPDAEPAAAATATAAVSATPRRLGLVVVEGSSIATSLPTRIPTTLEGINAKELARQINATDAEDALKYLPSLLVRKRYIGDYNHAVLSTRASGTGNSARSLVFADGVPLSNLLGNGAAFTPRWGMVTPEEIARVDVMYGPFSAAYSGNAVGAVVDYQTRMPSRFEAHARLGYSHQDNELYGQNRSFDATQASVAIGSRAGAWSWWLHAARLDSHGQPQTFATKLLASGARGSGVAVSGALQGQNRSWQDWWLIGSATEYETVQSQLKLKLAYDIAPGLSASLLLGLWDNASDGSPRSWLCDASGRAVDHRYGGGISQAVLINGQRYTLSASDFGRTRDDLQHLMSAFTLRQRGRPGLNWELSASHYDYRRDAGRAYAPSSAAAPEAGRLTDQAGTGWVTVSAKGSWAATAEHHLDFGAAQERYRLRNRVYALTDWRWSEPAASPASRFEGETALAALFLQDAWRFSPDWVAVLGLRAEQWRARRGLSSSGSNLLLHPARRESDLSPKAALSWSLGDAWVLKASTGRAIRYPTVSELFQGGFNGQGQAINNDPNLKPERSWTSELSAEWLGDVPEQRLRLTYFQEDSRDALYAQLNPATNANTVQNVERIRTRGLELAGSTPLAAPLRQVSLQGSLTYADSRILANSGYVLVPGDTIGKQQPRVPRWRATLVASWQALESLSLSWAARYSGRQYSSLDNSDPNGFAYQGASRYFSTDLRAQWRIDRRWTLAGGIDNLNNYQYWNFHPYPQRTFHAELRFDL